ncbi:MAG: hypothetical protein WCE48_06675 [Steroidobacteraceae bacterium]
MIATLPGEVRVTRPTGGTLRLRLAGHDGSGHEVAVDFAEPRATAMPELLHAVRIELQARGAWRILAREGAIEVAAASAHVHSDRSAQVLAAAPPRRAPLSKRLFWRLVLALAASGFGRRLLIALRSR